MHGVRESRAVTLTLQFAERRWLECGAMRLRIRARSYHVGLCEHVLFQSVRHVRERGNHQLHAVCAITRRPQNSRTLLNHTNMFAASGNNLNA